jgi:hypothetical protein
MPRTLPVLAAVACIVSAAGDARAVGPVDVEVGLKGGFATSPLSSGTNPVGGGIGARAGVVFLGGFYVGGSVLNYFFGSMTSPTASFSTNILMLGGEAGYGFTVGNRVTLRPQVGLGIASVATTATGAGATAEDKSTGAGYLYVEPGVTALVSLGLVFVGADANVVLLFRGQQQSQAAFAMHGEVGLRF